MQELATVIRVKDVFQPTTQTIPIDLERTGVAARWWSAFLLSCGFDFLRDLGERSPYETQLTVKTESGWTELRQFQTLANGNRDTVTIKVNGPHAAEVSKHFQDFVNLRSQRICLDSDGFAVA